MSDSESDDSGDRNIAEVTSDERCRIKERLSNLSFEDLQKLKEKIGTKVYNETVLQNKSKRTKAVFKRANKNRPREMSSKKRIKIENNVIPVKKTSNRDPRFEPMCGAFDKNTFKKDYKFVNELRKKEKSQLEKQLKETSNLEEKKKLKFVLQRLNNQIYEEERKDHLEQEERKEVNEIKTKLKSGEKVHFKKKSVKKLENLITKFEDLKKSNKLQKHLERRSKKISAKEKKKIEQTVH